MEMFSSVLPVLLVLALAATHIKSDCTNGREFMNQCGALSYNIKVFLSNERPSLPPEYTCTCNNPSRWVVSSDHHRTDLRTVNTSLPRYTVSGNNMVLQLNVDTIVGEDGGFYQCDCNSGYDGFCILVYERAVFASCPNETDGCSDETMLTVVAGENIDFNATVMYAPGGNCDFQQAITRISLTKINETFGGTNTPLYNCPTGEGETCPPGQSDRVTLNRGNRPGLNFIFTLSDTIYGNDSGLYEVNVTREHPRTTTETMFTKQFRLRVDQAPPTTTADEQTSSSNFETTTDQAAASTASSSSNIAGVIAAAVLVPLALIVLVTLGILLLAVKWQQVFHKQPPPEKKEEETPMQNIPQEETDTAEAEALNGLHGTAKLEVVQQRRLPLNPIQTQPGKEGEMVVQLPPENQRRSYIEIAMHELPEAMELPLTDEQKFTVLKQTSLQSESVAV